MVKCLIRITTRVNVHLRMINHCYRDVKVRVLSLGPRLLGKALGVLPLYPALTGEQEGASAGAQAAPLPGGRPSSRGPGKSPAMTVPPTQGNRAAVCMCRCVCVYWGEWVDRVCV